MNEIEKLKQEIADLKKIKHEEETAEPTALKENTYLFLGISFVVIAALWNAVGWQVILSIESSLFLLIFNGWIKKWREMALVKSKQIIGLKDDEILKLKAKIAEFISKTNILDEIVSKLSAQFPILDTVNQFLQDVDAMDNMEAIKERVRDLMQSGLK